MLPLTILFNKSLRTVELLRDWINAIVTPIFKKSDKREPGNYKSISLRFHISKIVEKCMRRRRESKNNFTSEHQHGFTKRRSCLTNLLECLETWTKEMDRNIPLDALYVDLEKAFETVLMERLLLKLERAGITGSLLI